MTNQMSQNLSWFRQPAVSNYLTTDSVPIRHGPELMLERFWVGRSGVSTTRRISSGEYTASSRVIPSRVTRSQAA